MRKLSAGKFHLQPPASHHSITSSARASSDAAMAMRSALAVIRLITRSNLMGLRSQPLIAAAQRTNCVFARFASDSSRSGRPFPDTSFKIWDVLLQLLERKAKRKQMFELAGGQMHQLTLAHCGELQCAGIKFVLQQLERRRVVTGRQRERAGTKIFADE